VYQIGVDSLMKGGNYKKGKRTERNQARTEDTNKLFSFKFRLVSNAHLKGYRKLPRNCKVLAFIK
jgi:hypothetical protein